MVSLFSITWVSLAQHVTRRSVKRFSSLQQDFQSPDGENLLHRVECLLPGRKKTEEQQNCQQQVRKPFKDHVTSCDMTSLYCDLGCENWDIL